MCRDLILVSMVLIAIVLMVIAVVIQYCDCDAHHTMLVLLIGCGFGGYIVTMLTKKVVITVPVSWQKIRPSQELAARYP